MAKNKKSQDTEKQLPEHVQKVIDQYPERKSEYLCILYGSEFTYTDGKPTIQYGKNGTWGWEKAFFHLNEFRRVFGENLIILPRKPEKRTHEAIIAQNTINEIRIAYRIVTGKHTESYLKWFNYHKPALHATSWDIARELINQHDKPAYIKSKLPEIVRIKKAETEAMCAHVNKPITIQNILNDMEF